MKKSLEQYIEQYGPELGPLKYQTNQEHTERFLRRKAQGTLLRKSNYTQQDIEDGLAVKCQECGKILCSVNGLHLRKCSKNVHTVAEYRRKYPDSPIMSPKLRKRLAITLESMIIMYGEEEGKKRWKSYCHKQAITNTYEYKHEKYGWTKEQFKKYNKSRSVTLENLIKRHGKLKGKQIWENYKERQSYTCSKEYFTETYGQEAGRKKFMHWMISGRICGDSHGVSKVESEVWDKLDELLGMKGERQIAIADDRRFTFDYGFPERKKLIEFNGTFWHMDPRFYKSYEINNISKKTAKQCWDRDKKKKKLAVNSGYDVYTIWEDDWYENPEFILKEAVSWIR